MDKAKVKKVGSREWLYFLGLFLLPGLLLSAGAYYYLSEPDGSFLTIAAKYRDLSDEEIAGVPGFGAFRKSRETSFWPTEETPSQRLYEHKAIARKSLEEIVRELSEDQRRDREAR
jgi:hypothetical protein